MIKFTLKDFEQFDIKDGYLLCPQGDYSDIKEIPSKCIFADGCVFDNEVVFEKD